MQENRGVTASMIHRLSSDLPKFKTLEFHAGLNVVLSGKSPSATDLHTRNRAGKSSLLEIVRFLLGRRCDNKDLCVCRGVLNDACFEMSFDLNGKCCRVRRVGEKHAKVDVAGDSIGLLGQQSLDGFCRIEIEDWSSILGREMFGLSESSSLSFQSIISYFVRLVSVGGMESAAKHSPQQKNIDQQASLSFLIGLDWEVPYAWKGIEDRDSEIRKRQKSIEERLLGISTTEPTGTPADLQSEYVLAQEKARRIRREVSSFKVHERYRELEKEASDLTKALQMLADENTLDRRHISQIESVTIEEEAPNLLDLQTIYKQAGLVLPNAVTKRFEDVRVFHESVVRNRRQYLAQEIEDARKRIESRDRTKAGIDARRSDIMRVLQSSGALDCFSALQSELVRAESEALSLQRKYESAKEAESERIALESERVALESERIGLLDKLRRDHLEKQSAIDDAIVTFNEISSELYEKTGSGKLAISRTENGPVFDPRIPGRKSKSVAKMQIFCFDMMLMLQCQKRGRSPGFLIHDSHLFDGVDERQVGKALWLGKKLAEENGFQYIVTMNTDDLPGEVPSGFDIQEHSLPVMLMDASDDGGLFGFRFD